MHLARRLVILFAPVALLFLAACDGGCASGWNGNPDVHPPATAAAAEESPSPVPAPGRTAPRFAPGQLEHHFQKHGAEMGFKTQAEYLRAAQTLVLGGPGVETYQRGGDTLYFREATGEFAVVSERNVLRTYFKPDDGRRYWERQKER